MILATIGNSNFVLTNLEQANQLLQILGEAKQVESDYLISESRYIKYEVSSEANIKIEVIPNETVLTKHEAKTRINKDKEARRPRAASND